MMTVQKMVKQLRKSLSQPQIAKAVGTSQSQVARIEDGQIPNYELGKKIEVYFIEHYPDSAA